MYSSLLSRIILRPKRSGQCPQYNTGWACDKEAEKRPERGVRENKRAEEASKETNEPNDDPTGDRTCK
jgi:hypothetical protein